MLDFAIVALVLTGWWYLRRRKAQPKLTKRQRWYRGTYLKSKHWRDTAARKRKQAGYKCQRCGKRRRLDVHHITYKRLGRERMTDLMALCRKCHKKEHKK